MPYVEDLQYVFSTNSAIELNVIVLVLTVVTANFIFLSTSDTVHSTFNQSLVVTLI